jgi:hypothetical protein
MPMSKVTALLAFFIAACLAGCTPPIAITASNATGRTPVAQQLPNVVKTEVRDLAALEKLRGNSGLTLQWIGWDDRGTLEVSQRGAVVHLNGEQIGAVRSGHLIIEGDLVSIDGDHFIFRGQIEIFGSPDAGRSCIKNGDSEFAITQGRKYWRMREFEWCDQLTDYIDIYF